MGAKGGKRNMSEVHGFLCGPKLYEFEGLEIEFPACSGPAPLKANGDPYQRIPKHVAEKMSRFLNLSDDEMAKYRTGGGCRAF